MSTVYLDGEYLPKEEAKVSVDDRGFLLADGVYDRPTPDTWSKGWTAITAPDRRWGRVDIKTVCLLPNVLAAQAAADAGADDAILVKDGVALEGALQNFWAVFDGIAVTHPLSQVVLGGITRGVVLELARENGIPAEERAIHVEELAHAEEVFFTGTTAEVRPYVEVDGRPVGDGRVGPITRALSKAYLKRIERVQAEAHAVRT